MVRYRTTEYTEVNGQLNILEEWRTDPKGVVTSLVFRQQGQEYVANRLP